MAIKNSYRQAVKAVLQSALLHDLDMAKFNGEFIEAAAVAWSNALYEAGVPEDSINRVYDRARANRAKDKKAMRFSIDDMLQAWADVHKEDMDAQYAKSLAVCKICKGSGKFTRYDFVLGRDVVEICQCKA